jgi:hypothetical protein
LFKKSIANNQLLFELKGNNQINLTKNKSNSLNYKKVYKKTQTKINYILIKSILSSLIKNKTPFKISLKIQHENINKLIANLYSSNARKTQTQKEKINL